MLRRNPPVRRCLPRDWSLPRGRDLPFRFYLP
jgi:hypothetical protein